MQSRRLLDAELVIEEFTLDEEGVDGAHDEVARPEDEQLLPDALPDGALPTKEQLHKVARVRDGHASRRLQNLCEKWRAIMNVYRTNCARFLRVTTARPQWCLICVFARGLSASL